ncbi:hypothetical protein BDL97_05G044800 [Sphagnum fallax]|nr:hypothetical protein BDL97_05G044800 [Sphagnum fallax]
MNPRLSVFIWCRCFPHVPYLALTSQFGSAAFVRTRVEGSLLSRLSSHFG